MDDVWCIQRIPRKSKKKKPAAEAAAEDEALAEAAEKPGRYHTVIMAPETVTIPDLDVILRRLNKGWTSWTSSGFLRFALEVKKRRFIIPVQTYGLRPKVGDLFPFREQSNRTSVTGAIQL